ncbi:MAG: hypothetical protein J6I86_09450 [Bacteroidaceae bacterium]|nr:hypothetical protein [Bacteroidaceae bacterium]
MKNLKLLALLLLLAPCSLLLAPCSLHAQVAGTLSSYSRFGLGLPHDQSQGFNKSMGGVGLGFRIGNRVNVANPASYSAIDSLSLILDVGMSGSFGRMSQGAKSVGINNATFDYVHAGMHIAKNLGLALGYMPYTSIGYDFSSPDQSISSDVNTTLPITSSNSYNGSGGLNVAYAGLGWRAFKNISIGANIGFVWGKYYHLMMPLFKEGGISSASYNSTLKSYTATLRTFKIDLGAQYPVRLTRQDWLNLGFSVGIGHKIAQDATLVHYTTVGDSTSFTASSPFDLPTTFGFGAAWQHKNTLLVGADVHYERWGKCRMPIETANGYEPMEGLYRDMTRIALGSQWTPNPYGKFWERIQYRAGINYSTPYLKINGQDGPMEFKLSMGAGIPIINKINNRSVVNVGVGWLRRSASATGMIKEDYFVISLGMTFNERWFMRYKIE